MIGLMILTYAFDVEFGGRLAVLTDLYVVAGHRRRGVGTAAIEFARRFCRSMNLCALELQVQSSNAEAIALYRRFGFEPHDRVPMTLHLQDKRMGE